MLSGVRGPGVLAITVMMIPLPVSAAAGMVDELALGIKRHGDVLQTVAGDGRSSPRLFSNVGM